MQHSVRKQTSLLQNVRVSKTATDWITAVIAFACLVLALAVEARIVGLGQSDPVWRIGGAVGQEHVLPVTGQRYDILNIAGASPTYPRARIDRHAPLTPRNDAHTTGIVEAQYGWHDRLGQTAINVSTFGGVVYLRGTVATAAQSGFAEEIAANTLGVVRVVNELQVGGHTESPIDVSRSRQSTSSAGAEDRWTTSRVKAVVAFDRRLCGADVAVHTEDGVVNLTGSVTSAHQGRVLLDLVNDLSGVRQVRSEIQLPQEGGVRNAPFEPQGDGVRPAVHSYTVNHSCTGGASDGTTLLM